MLWVLSWLCVAVCRKLIIISLSYQNSRCVRACVCVCVLDVCLLLRIGWFHSRYDLFFFTPFTTPHACDCWLYHHEINALLVAFCDWSSRVDNQINGFDSYFFLIENRLSLIYPNRRCFLWWLNAVTIRCIVSFKNLWSFGQFISHFWTFFLLSWMWICFMTHYSHKNASNCEFQIKFHYQ